MNYIINDDAISALKKLPDEYVNCIITSPPYYQLRDYAVKGQIGLEASPEEYISKLVNVFNEARRVLKNDGTLWLNIADSYAGSRKGAGRYSENAIKYKQGTNKGMLGNLLGTTKSNCKNKDLIGIPWMLAFALREDGWYLRQDIIWNKSNAMPESVKDRCTKSHEYIFLLTKSKKYFFNHEAIKEPAAGFNNEPIAGSKGAFGNPQSRRRKTEKIQNSGGNIDNVTGLRAKRSVWTVATKGYNGAHFATFPPELIKPCILAGTSKGDIVLDMFAGSGTVAEVALKLDRNYCVIDISTTYCELIKNRVDSI